MDSGRTIRHSQLEGRDEATTAASGAAARQEDDNEERKSMTTTRTTRRPPDVLESDPMIDETEERQLYIVSDELPAMKRSIKRLADDEKTSSTELMIRALCHHYGLAPPVRERRPARKVENAESLQLMVPTDLWLAIHNESGALLTSKKAVVLAVFHELIDKGHVAKKRKAK